MKINYKKGLIRLAIVAVIIHLIVGLFLALEEGHRKARNGDYYLELPVNGNNVSWLKPVDKCSNTATSYAIWYESDYRTRFDFQVDLLICIDDKYASEKDTLISLTKHMIYTGLIPKEESKAITNQFSEKYNSYLLKAFFKGIGFYYLGTLMFLGTISAIVGVGYFIFRGFFNKSAKEVV